MCLQVTSTVKIDTIRKISINYGMTKIYGAYRSESKENPIVMNADIGFKHFIFKIVALLR